MLSLCFSHVATVTGPFPSSVFHFLAKLSKSEIFLPCEKKEMKLSLLRKNINASSHRKGNLMALTAAYQFELWLKVWDIPCKFWFGFEASTFRAIKCWVNRVSPHMPQENKYWIWKDDGNRRLKIQADLVKILGGNDFNNLSWRRIVDVSVSSLMACLDPRPVRIVRVEQFWGHFRDKRRFRTTMSFVLWP